MPDLRQTATGSSLSTSRVLCFRAPWPVHAEGGLILNLPDLERAAVENLSPVIDALEHAMCMIAVESH